MPAAPPNGTHGRRGRDRAPSAVHCGVKATAQGAARNVGMLKNLISASTADPIVRELAMSEGFGDIYPHFFSLQEEQDIRARLTHVRKNGAERHAKRVIPGRARAPGVRYSGEFAQAG